MNPFNARHLPSGAARRGSFRTPFLGVPIALDRPVRRRLAEPPPARPQDGASKASLTVDEAKDLLATLDVVLRPISNQERAVEEHECLREFEAGPYPMVVRLRERLTAFIMRAGEGAQGQPSNGTAATFDISQGELVHVEKAVACAESIGRGKMLKVAMAGGGAALLALLLLA